MKNIKPTLRAVDGMPQCSLDDCPSHDGKLFRCQILNKRPDYLCEPALLEIKAQRDELLGVAEGLQNIRAELLDSPQAALVMAACDAAIARAKK